MPDRSKPCPHDPKRFAHNVFLESIGDQLKTEPPKEKNSAAVALGRLGGGKGDAGRAAALSPRKRPRIAARAAAKCWGKK